MENINQLKVILNDWKTNNDIAVLKDLILDYIQVYTFIRSKAELLTIDEKVYEDLFNYYTHIKQYENEISISVNTKKVKGFNENNYNELNLEELLTRLEEIREEFYIADRMPFFDDNLLELLSDICSELGDNFYNKFFPE